MGFYDSDRDHSQALADAWEQQQERLVAELAEVRRELQDCEQDCLLRDIRRAVYPDEKAELLIQLFTAWRDRETDAVLRSMHAEWISQLQGWLPQWAQDRVLDEEREDEEARADLRRIRGY